MTVKPKILFILQRYPQLSETYIKTEINALQDAFDIHIVSLQKVGYPDPDQRPFRVMSDLHQILALIRELKPQALHTHYLNSAGVAISLAEASGVPFTLRAHSFDSTLPPGKPIPPDLFHLGPIARHPLCRGILCFPYTLPLLEQCGVPTAKIHPVPPVIDFHRFHDEGPNGDGIMDTGACLPKKKMEDFLELARLTPELTFDLYPIGYDTAKLTRLNEQLGGPARIFKPVPYAEMPRVYKSHSWLVYTACREIGTVGWPMAVAEAQAAGLGICLANLRPDQETYLGGAGFVFNSLEEARDIIRRPYPEAMRRLGFENARRCDIHAHKGILAELWNS